jgi:hypothetical protein
LCSCSVKCSSNVEIYLHVKLVRRMRGWQGGRKGVLDGSVEESLWACMVLGGCTKCPTFCFSIRHEGWFLQGFAKVTRERKVLDAPPLHLCWCSLRPDRGREFWFGWLEGEMD